MDINKDIKLYLKSIRLLLPAHSHPEKEFLTDIETRIRDIVLEYPDITIKDIEEQLGTPLEISQNYIASLDTDDLLKRLSNSRIVKRIFIVFVICAVFSISIFAGFTYKAYLDSKNTVITNTETIITDE